MTIANMCIHFFMRLAYVCFFLVWSRQMLPARHKNWSINETLQRKWRHEMKRKGCLRKMRTFTSHSIENVYFFSSCLYVTRKEREWTPFINRNGRKSIRLIFLLCEIYDHVDINTNGLLLSQQHNIFCRCRTSLKKRFFLISDHKKPSKWELKKMKS